MLTRRALLQPHGRTGCTVLMFAWLTSTSAMAAPITTTRFVSTSGVDAGDCTVNPCRTIPFAIDNADDGDTIRIAPGTYTETFAITSRTDLTIEGESAATTIIQGDGVSALIRVRSSLGLTIRDLTVRDGGPFVEGGGQVEGGGISVFGPHSSSNSVVLENLILTGNHGPNGGAIGFQGGALTIVNCLIVDNAAINAGGAMIVRNDSTVTMEATTVANNHASFLAGGVVNEAHLTVRNSIFWNNTLEQIHTNPAGPPAVATSVRFSDIQGGHAGLANIDQDPLFVDAANGDFRLRSGSPAIDAGKNSGAPATDLDGKARPIDGDGDGIADVDMGAFEFGAPDTTPPAITVSANPTTLWPPNGRLVSVKVSGTIKDEPGSSGVDASSAVFVVLDEYGRIQPRGTVTLQANGRYTFTVALQASRRGNDRDGRHYTIAVIAEDGAGNIGVGSTIVTVPHDRGKAREH
ncbi:hypothetical protein JM946_23680 [Steroidobacter sp. S1-65]|uniref:Right handed beta helix domain-containing protein n=1 Tax=Steroidobacter gossypii TaxID=2805490 RepID=A0ABS1X3J2_9GAMM|nr:choice-of-anchor Q domain-containing protein [Steroidobacter gossypii]MBM0107757.1 hypothetical protein [Steroidobacter gossypii]